MCADSPNSPNSPNNPNYVCICIYICIQAFNVTNDNLSTQLASLSLNNSLSGSLPLPNPNNPNNPNNHNSHNSSPTSVPLSQDTNNPNSPNSPNDPNNSPNSPESPPESAGENTVTGSAPDENVYKNRETILTEYKDAGDLVCAPCEVYIYII